MFNKFFKIKMMCNNRDQVVNEEDNFFIYRINKRF